MLTRPRSARRRLTQQHVTRQHKDMNEYQIVRVREGDSGTFTEVNLQCREEYTRIDYL